MFMSPLYLVHIRSSQSAVKVSMSVTPCCLISWTVRQQVPPSRTRLPGVTSRKSVATIYQICLYLKALTFECIWLRTNKNFAYFTLSRQGQNKKESRIILLLRVYSLPRKRLYHVFVQQRLGCACTQTDGKDLWSSPLRWRGIHMKFRTVWFSFSKVNRGNTQTNR
jgi:hypothetical protein